MGDVVTFYSYKGGVGRTMALANIATLLAQQGHNVLMIDWDLEAPGLEAFFKDYLDPAVVAKQPGVIDLLEKVASDADPTHLWQDFVLPVRLPGTLGILSILTSGAQTADYFGRVRSFDVRSFYEENQGGVHIEKLRSDWKQNYDFVLIDSRTGVTDAGGICTIQMPDMLALMFTATERSFEGVISIAARAAERRQSLPYERLNVLALPVLTRFDSSEEFETSQKWLQRFTTGLGEIYKDWVPTSTDHRKILEATKVPYASYFSFGEKLAVIEQGTSDPAGLGFAYENLAALVGNRLEEAGMLIENRGPYILRAAKGVSMPAPEIPRLSPEELKTVLEMHQVWVSSYGKSGRRAVLARADLTHASFPSANLAQANMREADIRGAKAPRVQLNEAILDGANASDADLFNANLSGASGFHILFRKARLRIVNAQKARLNASDWRDADASVGNFSNATLQNANLEGATFRRATFTKADLRSVAAGGARFEAADLSQADLTGAVGLQLDEQFAGANLSGAKLDQPALLPAQQARLAELWSRARFALILSAVVVLAATLAIAALSDAELLNFSKYPIGSSGALNIGVLGALLIASLGFRLLSSAIKASVNLPAVFPDGKQLYEYVSAGLLRAYAQPNTYRGVSLTIQILTVLVFFLPLPALVVIVWIRELRLHSWSVLVPGAILLVTMMPSTGGVATSVASRPKMPSFIAIGALVVFGAFIVLVSALSVMNPLVLPGPVRGLDLRDVSLWGQDLRGKDLRGAQNLWTSLKGADLRGARLDPSFCTDSFWDQTTQFDPKYLSNCIRTLSSDSVALYSLADSEPAFLKAHKEDIQALLARVPAENENARKISAKLAQP